MASDEDAFWEHDLGNGNLRSHGTRNPKLTDSTDDLSSYDNPGYATDMPDSQRDMGGDYNNVSANKQGKKTNFKGSGLPVSPIPAMKLREIAPQLTEVRQNLTHATNVAGRAIAAGAKQGIKTLTQPMNISKFGCFDVLTSLVSMGMFYFDVSSDILVAYYMHGDEATKEWFLATVLLLVIPLVIANSFSLYWYWFDEHICEREGVCDRSSKSSKLLWVFRILVHLLLHASILRSIDVLYYGVKSLKASPPSSEQQQQQQQSHHGHQHHHHHHHHHHHNHHNGEANGDQPRAEDLPYGHSGVNAAPTFTKTGLYYQKLWLHAERDAVNVDLLGSLLQDAPQLILQIYIMSYTVPEQALQGEISNTMMMQLLSVGTSLGAMAFSVASFSKATRLAEPSMGNLSAAALIVLTLTHFCSIAPQVLCFALFSTKYLQVFFIVVSCHWLAATLLILLSLVCCPNPLRMNVTFTHDVQHGRCHRLDDVFFSATFGLILLFTFMNVGGKQSKIQGAVFHVLRLLEEGLMIGFWYVETSGDLWYQWLPLVIVSSFFLLGILLNAIYYFCVHPDRRSNSTAA